MKHFKTFFILCSFTAFAMAADVTVKLTGMHLCCAKCVTGVQKAAATVAGVKSDIEKEAGTATLTAPSAEIAQKAVDAIAAAGYSATVAGATLAPVKVATGKVKSLTLTGIHNCCGACTKAIGSAVKSVPGVAESSLKAKETEFTVTGDFDGAALVAALEKAGFRAAVK